MTTCDRLNHGRSQKRDDFAFERKYILTMLSLIERGVRTMGKFSLNLGAPDAKKVRIESPVQTDSGSNHSDSEESGSGKSSQSAKESEERPSASLRILRNRKKENGHDIEDEEEDEFAIENDQAIQFIKQVLKDVPLDEAAGDLSQSRTNDLLSAIHWTGLELNESIRMGLLLSALEASQRTVRQNISNFLMMRRDTLYLNGRDLTYIAEKNDKQKVVTVEIPGPIQVRAEAGRLHLTSTVPGELNVIHHT